MLTCAFLSPTPHKPHENGEVRVLTGESPPSHSARHLVGARQITAQPSPSHWAYLPYPPDVKLMSALSHLAPKVPIST